VIDHLDNQAGRLWLLLSDFVQGGDPGREKVWQRWQGILFPAQSVAIAKVYVALAELAEIPAELRLTLEALDVPDAIRDEYSSTIDKVNRALRAGPDELAVEVKKIASPAMLSDLKHFSFALSQHAPEPVVAKEDLDKIRTSLQQLIEDLTRWSTTERLRRVLLDMCNQMLDAVDLYRIKGTDGIEEELERIFGRGLISGRHLEAPSSRGREFVQRLGKVAAQTAFVIGVFKGAAELPAQVDDGVKVVQSWFDDELPAIESGDVPDGDASAPEAGDG